MNLAFTNQNSVLSSLETQLGLPRHQEPCQLGVFPFSLHMIFVIFQFPIFQLDYSSFSIRIYCNYLFTNNPSLNHERASNLYNELEEMVVNGTYDKLRKNVEIARDFFNYHRFGCRSPYGAALVSMYQDEINENKR